MENQDLKISVILAVSDNGIIGNNNKIPWKIPLDLKWFKMNTLFSTIVMGRKTWESIGCRSLPNRNIIVLSQSDISKIPPPNVIILSSFESVIRYTTNQNIKHIFIVGGTKLIESVINDYYIYRYIITHVSSDKEIEGDIRIELPLFQRKTAYSSRIYNTDKYTFIFKIYV